ncbi:hypothetical protein JTZ10_21690 [Gordonia rubripertincta]|uniref:Uncharacterized protein n=1 Tax=Gordonia rubripertincta TaxID=36822 RepID=A0AAW4GBN9_GORRU|nr:hypothetical protein [Gordonia rubripertincta]MBM7280361.1 hypothetical protein [Gordonia rubripertincta]
MPASAKRTVRLASAVYVDADGRTRRADHGAEITVHGDDLDRFDRFNGEEPKTSHEVKESKPAKASTRRSSKSISED